MRILLVLTFSAIVKAFSSTTAPRYSTKTPLAAPSRRFPSNTTWSLQRAPPKASLDLLPTRQGKTAAAWNLNLIEGLHWSSFPVGFQLAYYIFAHADTIAQHLDNDSSRVFLLILATMTQIFGGGTANLMHEYEGWQVCPFRNPLALPDQNVDPTDLDQIRVPKYNNAWLRAAVYQLLFTFQTLALALITTAAYGVTWWTSLLLGATVFVGLVGPRQPSTNFTRNVDGEERPVFPLPYAMFISLVVNGIAVGFAYMSMFHHSVSAWQAASGLALLAKVPSFLLVLAPPVLLGGGGVIEGYFAESSFNQWHHFGAFVVLMAGLVLHFWEYATLVAHQ